MLEQANNATAQKNATGQENEGAIDRDNDDETLNSHTSPNHEMVVKDEQDAKILSLTSEPDTMVTVTGHDSDSNIEASIIISESNKVEEAEPQMEQAAVVGNSMKVELINHVEDVHTLKEQSEKLSETPPIMTPTLKVIIMLIYFLEIFFLF